MVNILHVLFYLTTVFKVLDLCNVVSIATCAALRFGLNPGTCRFSGFAAFEAEAGAQSPGTFNYILHACMPLRVRVSQRMGYILTC